MRRLHEFWVRLRCLFRRRELERDLRDELEFHLAMTRGAGGENPLRSFGNVARVYEETRARWRFAAVETLLADLRFGARSLSRSPSFSVAAAAMLVLGIGGNAAILSVVQALLLRPVPGVYAPEQLIAIGQSEGGTGFGALSYADAADLLHAMPSLESGAVWRPLPMTLETGATERPVSVHAVSAAYFDVMRPAIELGRASAGPGEVVLGHGLWRSVFSANREIVGRKLLLDGAPVTVAGVAARPFCGVSCGSPAEVWAMLPRDPAADSNRALHAVWMIGRLRRGATPVVARAQLGAVAERLKSQFPREEDIGFTINPNPGVEPNARGSLASYFELLAGVTLLVLATVCANLGNLLLARGAARHREMATRLAIGASRPRLVRQLLTESLLLAGAGACGGWALAYGAAEWIHRRPRLPPALASYDLRPDWRVFVFAVALSLFTGLAFGVGPALAATRPVHLRGSRARFREWLIACQIALSLALVVAAGLLIQSLVNAQGIRLGFETKGIWITGSSFPKPDSARYVREAAALRARFGDAAVSAIGVLPLQGRAMDGPVEIDGRRVPARFNAVGDGHFALLRIPLRQGREFTTRDHANSVPVVVVNEAFARAYGARAGQTLRAFPDREPRQIIGVVGDHIYAQLREQVRPAIYRPLAQAPAAQFTWEIRGDADAVRRAATGTVRAMDDLFRAELWQSRVTTSFVAAFAGLALLLASIGLYGIVAYSVAQRQREIGLRVALGARPGQIAGLFLRRVALLTGCGVLLGNAGAILGAGALRSQLYGVAPADPGTVAAADLLLAAVAGIAALVPVWRALGVDAADALRQQ